MLIILLEVIGGIAVGFVLGLFMKFFKKCGHVVKSIVTMIVTVLFVVLSEVFNVPEAKYVGIITYGYLCFRWWGISGKPEHLLA